DPLLVDHALRQVFSVPRSVETFSRRGIAIANDIRDGDDPAKIRRFSEAILSLRKEPNLLAELTQEGEEAIAPILFDEKFKEQQRAAKSIFFFVASEHVL